MIVRKITVDSSTDREKIPMQIPKCKMPKCKCQIPMQDAQIQDAQIQDAQMQMPTTTSKTMNLSSVIGSTNIGKMSWVNIVYVALIICILIFVLSLLFSAPVYCWVLLLILLPWVFEIVISTLDYFIGFVSIYTITFTKCV